MDRLRLGLVGACYPNFDAIKLGVYEHSKQELRDLARLLDFDLVVVEEVVQSGEDAGRAARQLGADQVDLVMIQASSFVLGDLILPLADLKARLGLWFLREPRLEGAIPLNSFTGFNLMASTLRRCLPERDRPFKWFYGAACEPGFRRRLEITIRALRMLKDLSRTRLGVIGEPEPTFGNLMYNPQAIGARLGVQIENIRLQDVFRRVATYREAEAAEIVEAMVSRAARVQVAGEWLARTARVVLSLSDVAREGGYRALAVRCWPEFQTELGGLAPCAAVSWLNDNGLPTSCEDDVLGAISMLAGHSVSGAPATLTDLVAVDDVRGLALMWHCGPAAASWADGSGQALTHHPTLDRASPPDAPRSGLSSDLIFAPGPVTIARFSPDASRLLLMSADVVPGPSKGYAGSRGWLANLRMNGEGMSISDLIETVAYHGLAHHYPLVRGDWTVPFLELAGWAGLRLLKPIPYRDHLVSPVSWIE